MSDSQDRDDTSDLSYVGRFIYTLVLATVLGGGYFYRDNVTAWLAGEGMEMPVKMESSSTKDAPEKKKVKHWVAPMDPSYKRDKPGKSLMGMDLVPVYENDGDDSGIVSISPAMVQNIGVRSVAVSRMDIKKTIRTVGLVAYDETKLTKIQSKVPGWVEKLYVGATGDKVAYNTILLEIYSPDLVSTQEEFLLALKYRDSMKEGGHESMQDSSDALLESSRRRLELFDVPAHQIAELEKQRKVKKTLHIHSYSDGIVVKKNVIEGMYVKPGVTLYEIADLRKVWVNMDIFEYEIPYVKVGQSAVMTLASAPGKTFKGKIAYIYPFVEKKSRSVKVRIEFDNKKMMLKPDMYGEILLYADAAKNVLAVPSEAVIRTGERSVVFVDKGEGKFEPRSVTLGMESEEMVAILSGLNEGERVVTSAQFLIDSESKLKGVVSKIAPTLKPDMGDMDMGGLDMGNEPKGNSKMDHSQHNH